MKVCLVCEGVSPTEQDACASCGTRLVRTDEVHFPLRRGEEDAANPLLGAVIDGKYRVSDVLGKGGMGAVYRAVHQVSLVPVALKILHPRYAARAEHRAHFLAEARKAARVIHEHSARVLDVGQDPDGTVYIAMELVEGVTLAEWIHGGEPLLPADVVEILDQISQALVAAHEVGLVHRDLSPRNVMGTVRDGRPFVKILDFGIAKGPLAWLSGELQGSDAPGNFASPPYSAPEHLAGADVDARADLYSLGVIAYEALTRRLPVDGENAAELARATVEGRTKPLRAPSGTPHRLARLVTRLLARDPRQRPASAKDVLRELRRIRTLRGPVRRAVALGGLLVTLPAFLVTHTGRDTPFLELQHSEALQVHAERPAPDTRAQELRSEDLDELRFRFGGFDPGELRIEAGAVSVTDLQPQVAVDGDLRTLTLSRRSDAYARLIAQLAAQPQHVDLVFQVPGLPTLGYARILVDDEPPEVELVASVGPNVLNGIARVIVNSADKGTLRELTLEVRERGAKSGAIPVLGRGWQPAPKAAALLGEVLEGCAPREDVALQVVAVDRAGNTAHSQSIHFATVDLTAPAVRQVLSRRGDGVVTYGPEGAWVRVSLDEVEPGLVLVVHGEEGEVRVGLDGAKTEQEVLVPRMRAEAGPPFASGPYTFHVEDPAGNAGPPHHGHYRFESENPSASLVAAHDGGEVHGLAVVGEGDGLRQIVTDGHPARLLFRCNARYRPVGASVRGGEPAAVTLAGVEPGGGVLELGELADGEYALAVDIADETGFRGPQQLWALRVMREAMVLELPPAQGLRFRKELTQADLLRFDGNRIQQGAGWQLAPPDARLLCGHVWFGRDGELLRYELPALATRDAEIVGGQLVRHGTNVLALDLRDPLGRRVEVRFAGAPAPLLPLPDGSVAHEVARFAHQTDLPVVDEPEVLVEYGEPSRVTIRSAMPFRSNDSIRLRIASASEDPQPAIPALAVEADGDGSLLRFSIPYDAIAAAADWKRLTREAVARSRIAELKVDLATPAGNYDVALNVRTIRSSLRPLEWQGVAGPERELPVPLRGIRMVPVLGPDGVLDDPVPADLPSRADFRPMPPVPVSNVGDVYLQQGEVTRAQYDALMGLAAASPLIQRLSNLLHHAADPLGPNRLRALRPRMFEDDRAGWRRAVEEGPERPVTGVDFFQAYAMTRIAGVVLRGDPDLLRLPMGVELELAALGAEDRHPGALNGCGRQQPPLRVTRFHEFEKLRHDLSRWPPTLQESRDAGDVVPTALGEEIVALDFGVREWVLDLPVLRSGDGLNVLREWIADHTTHLARVTEFARAKEGAAESFEPYLERNGVVRGVAVGEASCLIEAISEKRPLGLGGAPLPITVPGVVRVLVLRRDGLGLCDELDPHLRDIGFRFAGGRDFIGEVRK